MGCVRLRDTRNTQSNGGVDGRCDGAEDECQGSEGGNKPLRQTLRDVSSLIVCRTDQGTAYPVRWECPST